MMIIQQQGHDSGVNIVIIGGGFTGAAIAAHLVGDRALSDGARVVVVEPRADLGRGLAYGTDDPAHRINVPATKMTLYPDRPEDFETYLSGPSSTAGDEAVIGRDGQSYPHRSVFGDYVVSMLRPLIADGRVEHWRTKIATVTRDGDAYHLRGMDGREMQADLLVIAVSHPAPALPPVLERFRHAPKLIGDVTVPGALDPIAPDDRILIVGNGLTSADVVASLEKRGHRGPITSMSRRGLRSRGHGPTGQEAYGDFLTAPAPTASRLLQRARLLVREARASGLTWHSVLDTLRSQGQAIWAGLPMSERRRLACHVRPFWDVHRFRIAPQIEDVIDRAVAEGRLEILAASLAAIEQQDHAFKVDLRQRHGRKAVAITVDAIVVTTGPAHGGILESQPFLRDLQAVGVLRPCPTGLGVACDGDAHPVSATGEAVSDILIAGPLARGTFGELMGLPQVTEHAVFVARRIEDWLARRIGRRRILPKPHEQGDGRTDLFEAALWLEKNTL